MKKQRYVVTIVFETDAPSDAVQVVVEDMTMQLETLGDGSLEDRVDRPDCTYDYEFKDYNIEEV